MGVGGGISLKYSRIREKDTSWSMKVEFAVVEVDRGQIKDCCVGLGR